MSNKQEKNKMLIAGAEAQFIRKLRSAAEKKLAKMPHAKTPTRPAEEILYELQVYQIELEMQSEELQRAQRMIEESRDRYTNFYDLAPVGYVTISLDGLIDEINLTGATLLGKDRGKLMHKRFASFVVPEDRDRWDQCFASVLQSEDKLTCELALLRGDKSRCQVRLDSLRMLKDDNTPAVRAMVRCGPVTRVAVSGGCAQPLSR